MRLISEIIKKDPAFGEILNALDGGALPGVIGGVSHIHRCALAAACLRLHGGSVVVICPEESDCTKVMADLESLTETQGTFLPVREFSFFDSAAASHQFEQRRIAALYAMAKREIPLLVTTPDALMQRTIPVDGLMERSIVVSPGDIIDPEKLADDLTLLGYRRVDTVESTGEFALRGGIIDVYSPGHPKPVRIELFGDEVDAMGIFSPDTQRRVENISKARLLPAVEVHPHLAEVSVEGIAKSLEKLLKRVSSSKNAPAGLADTIAGDLEKLRRGEEICADRYMHIIYPPLICAADYIPGDATVIMVEPGRCQQRGENYAWQMNQDIQSACEAGKLVGEYGNIYIPFDRVCAKLEEHPVIMADSFIVSKYPINPRTIVTATVKQLPGYGGSFDTAVGDIRYYVNNNYSTLVLAGDEKRAKELDSFLRERDIPVYLDFNMAAAPIKGQVMVSVGNLSAGMELPLVQTAIISEGQILSRREKRPERRQRGDRRKLDSYLELVPGDLVVHETHGIGRFVEIVKMQVDGISRDYMKIAYSGTDSLYVPALQLDMVSKYIGAGGEDKPVKLSKLGGTEWQKTKSRAKAAAKDMAKELIELYSKRQKIKGYAFSPDSPWQIEFEENFPFAETADQLRAASQIKSDMEKSVPMDRLLCGDVGYGKTEVALRAVMKCVLDGKQAAILVPTTVLAQQHYVTAMRRFAGFPVTIEVLSRFRSAAQIKASAARIASGEADVVIGTHRLLQKDIKFKDLGLIVVDEEQRFGVKHKEQLKQLSTAVDVLTLSATPIPRTLNMALSGIRDMSLIEEPPSDRYPVQTYVLEYDRNIIADAIRREVARGGQVYYLHNKVETIELAAAKVQEMCPDAAIAIAHGKESEAELGEVMRKMTEGEVQVLVCTTIIETGIDIPNVNTLIIEDADKLGLAQLHQIRGRVGRSTRRAYAYLTYTRGKVLTEVAAKRLEAIREFAQFGSGFKIAMRDLEIRGAGNILGAEQSGNMSDVGYEMYLRLLEEAVQEEQGIQSDAPQECTADLAVQAGIPEKYVPSGQQRMDLYRRIAQIRSQDDADELMDEVLDRYGEPPKSVDTLVQVALLRSAASAVGVKEILQKNGSVILKMRSFNLEKIAALCAGKDFKGRVLFSAGSDPHISLKINKGDDVMKNTRELIKALS